MPKKVKNTQLPHYKMSIGVENFCIELRRPQDHKPLTYVISFALQGNFINAAHSDDLSMSIDYDGLCQHIKALLKDSIDDDLDQVMRMIKSSILQFSPLISGGFLSMARHYQGAVLMSECLLEKG